MSIFDFQRSALKRISFSLFGSSARRSDQQANDLLEDQSDPYLSQSASLMTGNRKLFSSAEPGDSY